MFAPKFRRSRIRVLHVQRYARLQANMSTPRPAPAGAAADADAHVTYDIMSGKWVIISLFLILPISLLDSSTMARDCTAQPARSPSTITPACCARRVSPAADPLLQGPPQHAGGPNTMPCPVDTFPGRQRPAVQDAVHVWSKHRAGRPRRRARRQVAGLAGATEPS